MLLAPGGEEMLAHVEEELVDSEEALKSSELFWRILQRELSGLWHRDRQPSVSSSLLPSAIRRCPPSSAGCSEDDMTAARKFVRCPQSRRTTHWECVAPSTHRTKSALLIGTQSHLLVPAGFPSLFSAPGEPFVLPICPCPSLSGCPFPFPGLTFWKHHSEARCHVLQMASLVFKAKAASGC